MARQARYTTRAVASVVLALSIGSLVTAQEPAVIVAGRYVASDGSLKEGGALVLGGGKIVRIAQAAELEGQDNVTRYPGAVISPGLIDVRSRIGAYENLIESAKAIDPGASAMDSVDWNHRDYRSAVEAGITTVMLVPSENNLVSGVAAVIKTARTAGHNPILRDKGPLMFALGSSVFEYDRAPTSRIGSLAMLREALDQAAGGSGDPNLQAFARGRLDGIVVCERAMDVSAALRTFGKRRLDVAIVYTGDTQELASELVRGSRAIILGPYTFGTPVRTLSTAAAYDAGGVPVIFAAGMPEQPGDALRITAALAVRHGMAAAKARRAMTALPAILAGVADRLGTIRPGADADLVVFSDDPLRLDARVLAVYIDGVRVYRAGSSSITSRGGKR